MNPNPIPNDPSGGADHVADRNVERLLTGAYRPEVPDPAFVERATAAVHAAARRQSHRPLAKPSLARAKRLAGWAAAATLLVGLGMLLDGVLLQKPDRRPEETAGSSPQAAGPSEPEPAAGRDKADEAPLASIGLVARARGEAPPAATLAVGDSLETAAGQRRRLTLDDGSALYLNQNSAVTLDHRRHVTLRRGEIYVEVSPHRQPQGEDGKAGAEFVVATPGRKITALGTKFNVRLSDQGTGVVVTQGKVQVSGMKLPILAGQQLAPEGRHKLEDTSPVSASPRATHLLDWTRDLMAAAESPLVPESEYSGGALIAVDPNGQEAKLSLRKYHVDVHIEDGFARTTIDQTYFNHLPSRLEGTFYFPLPPDASLSRLAMYVEGKLMEGGMAERDHARRVYEDIVRSMKDPALLEWIDGSTFKMRVFPLEGRQEKRIILSYTQRLAALYDRTEYRFPGGHNMQQVGRWSARLRAKDGAGLHWESDSHDFTPSQENGGLVLEASAEKIKPDRDVRLTLYERKRGLSPSGNRAATSSGRKGIVPFSGPGGRGRFAAAVHEGSGYLMLRWLPELPRPQRHQRRDWIFLFESSADRDPLLARVQVDVIKTLLENARHDDTFAILTAGTRAHALAAEPQVVSPENVRQAVKFLEQTHLVGALDLGRALDATRPFVEAAENPVLVHLGSGLPALGPRDVAALGRRIPEGAQYVGVGVGKRWSRSLMKTAAGRSGGYFTQINPDEQVTWRAFELLATLNTPRLLNINVTGEAEQLGFLCHNDSLADGEELCAIARFEDGRELPASVEVTGTFDGEPYSETIPVAGVSPQADYLPRIWAKLEIDRLVALGLVKHKQRIIELSKAMYVMSPFTSLLVLENEEMYRRYKIDRGRKDHWALYSCPEKIKVVHEPLPSVAAPKTPETVKPKKPSAEEVLQTIVVRVPPPILQWPNRHPSPTVPIVLLSDGRGYGKHRRPDLSSSTFLIEALIGAGDGTNEEAVKKALSFLSRSQNLESEHYTTFLAKNPDVSAGWRYDPAIVEDASVVGWQVEAALSSLGARLANDGSWAFRHDPTFSIVTATSTLSVPDDGTLLLGGIKRLGEGRNEFGVPILTGLPYINRLFTNARIGREAESLMMMVTPRIIIQEEEDEKLLIDRFNSLMDERRYRYAEQAAASGVYPVADFILPIDYGLMSGYRGVSGLRGTGMGGFGLFDEDIDRPFQVFGRWIPADEPLRNTLDVDMDRSVEHWENVLRANPRSAEAYARLGTLLARRGDLARAAKLFEHALRIRPDSARAHVNLGRLLARQGKLDEAAKLFERVGMQSPGVFSADLDIPFARDMDDILMFRVLHQESSRIRFRGEPPIVYPSAEIWKALTARRTERYASMSVASRGPAVEKILEALKSPTKLEFVETSLQHVVDYLKDYQGIEIQIDTRALDDAGIGTDPPITCNFKGISLRSALRLILRELDLTYLIQDEVLLITTPEEAEARLRTNYYQAALMRRIGTGGGRRALTYQQPSFSNHWSVFYDLLSYAPGMNNNLADVLAVVEDECDPHPALKPGKIDEKARRLIEKARGAGWQTATITSKKGKLLLSVDFDGTGRYRYQRTTAGGLGEQAVCDGTNLWHLYPELGIGARRTLSRFHRRRLAGLLPWVLPPAEELARAADLKAIDERTVAIAPRGIEKLKDEQGKPLPYLRVHLVFEGDGRLAERRLVEMPQGKTLLRQTYAADGAIRWLDADEKVLAERKIGLKPCGAPDLKPDEKRLVVLPLPLRRRGFVHSAEECEKWSESHALESIADDLANNRGQVRQIVARRFINRGDRRLGFYTLLIADGYTWDPKQQQDFGNNVRVRLDPPADHPHDPLAKYVAAYLKLRQGKQEQFGPIGGRPAAGTIPAPNGGLLQQLAEFRDLWTLFSSGRANQGDQTKQKQARQRALKFIRQCRSPGFGWALLSESRKLGGDSQFHRQIAEAAESFENVPGLGYVARYERARATLQSGDWKQAQESFAQLYREVVKAGFLPPIDESFRQAFQQGDGSTKWQELLRTTSAKLIDAGARPAVIWLAGRIREVGDQPLAEELLSLALSDTPEKEQFFTMLTAFEYLWHSEQYPRAGRTLQGLLENEKYARWPSLWRLAVMVAEKRGMTARAADCLERAMDIEYQNLPETVNVKTIRSDYGRLLDRYQQLAAAITTLEAEPPRELVGRVIRAADRWRQMDPEPTAACQKAARIFADLGAAELAWDYLTTPLAAEPNEAAPLVKLAEMLRQQAQFDLADRAYASAFEAEPQNAQILWDRAQVLSEAGRPAEAKKLFRRVAEGDWQQEFGSIQSRAKQYVESW